MHKSLVLQPSSKRDNQGVDAGKVVTAGEDDEEHDGPDQEIRPDRIPEIEVLPGLEEVLIDGYLHEDVHGVDAKGDLAEVEGEAPPQRRLEDRRVLEGQDEEDGADAQPEVLVGQFDVVGRGQLAEVLEGEGSGDARVGRDAEEEQAQDEHEDESALAGDRRPPFKSSSSSTAGGHLRLEPMLGKWKPTFGRCRREADGEVGDK